MNLKLLHSTGNHQQNKKTTYELRENVCKQRDQQGINFQNTKTAHTAQYKKKKTTTQSKSGQKMYTDISLKGIYTDGQQARGKMLNIFVVTWMDHTK